MEYRNEWKHVISYGDTLTLRHRLRAVMEPDPFAGPEGWYSVRSLYFDTPEDTALRAKIDGVNHREKFRIRLYNHDHSLIRLEKKTRRDAMGKKTSAVLSPGEARAIVDGDLAWMPRSGRALVVELYVKMQAQRLLPKTIVDYTREAFTFPSGNTRVTLDYNLRTGLGSTDFLNPDCVTIPACEPLYLLEVKWDEFLPWPVRRAIQLCGRHTTAFSKYRTCRLYD